MLRYITPKKRKKITLSFSFLCRCVVPTTLLEQAEPKEIRLVNTRVSRFAVTKHRGFGYCKPETSVLSPRTPEGYFHAN